MSSVVRMSKSAAYAEYRALAETYYQRIERGEESESLGALGGHLDVLFWKLPADERQGAADWDYSRLIDARIKLGLPACPESCCNPGEA